MRKASISGLSLEEAIVQRVAADNPSLVGEVLAFGSPRIEMKTIIPKKEGAFSHIKISHVVMKGDLFISAGDNRIGKASLLTNASEEEVILIFGTKKKPHTSKCWSIFACVGEKKSIIEGSA